MQAENGVYGPLAEQRIFLPAPPVGHVRAPELLVWDCVMPLGASTALCDISVLCKLCKG